MGKEGTCEGDEGSQWVRLKAIDTNVHVERGEGSYGWVSGGNGVEGWPVVGEKGSSV